MASTTTVRQRSPAARCPATADSCPIPSDGQRWGGDGSIYNHATLTVNNNSAVSGNTSIGIENYGIASVTGSTVSDNFLDGIYNGRGATLNVSDSILCRQPRPGRGHQKLRHRDDHRLCPVRQFLRPQRRHLPAAAASIRQRHPDRLRHTLSGNSASGYGGGIMVLGGTATISGCTFSGNSAGMGGGIYVFHGSTVSLSNSTLSDNTARDDGGGIYVQYGSTLTLDNSHVCGNTAKYGGGIYIDGDSSPAGTVTIENTSTITDNLAPAGYSADDIDNLGVVFWDGSRTLGGLDGNAANAI